MNVIKQLSPLRITGRRRGAAADQPAQRLGWLDALRGIAAMSVAVYHLALPFVWVPHGVDLVHHLDPGVFGVMLFFLVSGYIVPASLERRGDVRAFWTGRIFRIYPVLIVIAVASLLVLPRAYAVVQGYGFDHPVLSLAANGLMLQDLMGVPNGMSVMWTLCYEMVFYYLVSGLFTLGRHRRSSSIAIGFAAIALVLGANIAQATISTGPENTRHLVLACAVVVTMGLLCIMSGNQGLVRTGTLLLAGLGLVLIFLNSRSTAFETMLIFATMFSGTVVYRAQHGQIDRLQAVFCCGFVVVSGFLVGKMYNHGPALWQTWTDNWMSFSFAYLAAWTVFGIGFLLRNRRFPRAITWLGAVSYSIYLLHNPVIHGMNWLLEGHAAPVTVGAKVLRVAAFLAALLVLSFLAHRLVELPGQKLGRLVQRTLDRRLPLRPAATAQPAGVPAQQAQAGRQLSPAGRE